MPVYKTRRSKRAMAALLCLAAGCTDVVRPEPEEAIDVTGAAPPLPNLSCALSADVVFAGGPGRDGIPALVNPNLVPLGHAEVSYVDEYQRLAREDPEKPPARVIGIMADGAPVAIPHNIMWWHEIVNIDVDGRLITVTYCPLTGSALAFDATAAGTQRFGVSGLIFQNNLIMFDEETGSLWPQMCTAAEYGDRAGDQLVPLAATDMLWETWKSRHPNTLVVSSGTGYEREYDRYPYLGYETHEKLLFPLPRPLDERREMKERVFGVPTDAGGIALPFAELSSVGPFAVIPIPLDGEIIQVLWDREARSAAAFRPVTTEGDVLTLQLSDGRITDRETGTEWDVEGRGVTGPLRGKTLTPYPSAYGAYWFAWSSFYPLTRIWTAE